MHANLNWKLKCLSLELKLNPQHCVHKYKWSVLTDKVFAESFVRKQNCCIWNYKNMFCSSACFQMKKLARRHQQQQEQQNSQRLGQGRGFVKKQSERERMCSCLEVPFPHDTLVQPCRAHAGLWVTCAISSGRTQRCA